MDGFMRRMVLAYRSAFWILGNFIISNRPRIQPAATQRIHKPPFVSNALIAFERQHFAFLPQYIFVQSRHRTLEATLLDLQGQHVYQGHFPQVSQQVALGCKKNRTTACNTFIKFGWNAVFKPRADQRDIG